jgi:TatD DNase family protein
VLTMLERYLPQDRGTVVLHWVTESRSEARRAATLGCYFSVNAEMTRSDRGRALVTELPIDRILTETDGPFTQIDHRPSEPAHVVATVAAIAKVRNLPVDRVASAVRSNLSFLVGASLKGARGSLRGCAELALVSCCRRATTPRKRRPHPFSR